MYEDLHCILFNDIVRIFYRLHISYACLFCLVNSRSGMLSILRYGIHKLTTLPFRQYQYHFLSYSNSVQCSHFFEQIHPSHIFIIQFYDIWLRYDCLFSLSFAPTFATTNFKDASFFEFVTIVT